MVNSRTYHSNRICYIILPERLKEQELPWLDSMAKIHNTNFVVISGVHWEEDLTPWKVPGLKGGEFSGKARMSSLNTTKATKHVLINN